eukprot:CAMPEP_0119520376 /NCGR_PEP_ID=MMETSP1344-20130328/36413_1 /TAXON_ID=236787 /ORGANISM="Florenciella parvula, Strain CCMP2471" /LENGTH=63 /DNA_ID=CAMNT_0007558257 /DNA_START=36 /DNA_END=223 /DNA_ORIENTATION=+
MGQGATGSKAEGSREATTTASKRPRPNKEAETVDLTDDCKPGSDCLCCAPPPAPSASVGGASR